MNTFRLPLAMPVAWRTPPCFRTPGRLCPAHAQTTPTTNWRPYE